MNLRANPSPSDSYLADVRYNNPLDDVPMNALFNILMALNGRPLVGGSPGSAMWSGGTPAIGAGSNPLMTPGDNATMEDILNMANPWMAKLMALRGNPELFSKLAGTRPPNVPLGGSDIASDVFRQV